MKEYQSYFPLCREVSFHLALVPPVTLVMFDVHRATWITFLWHVMPALSSEVFTGSHSFTRGPALV